MGSQSALLLLLVTPAAAGTATAGPPLDAATALVVTGLASGSPAEGRMGLGELVLSVNGAAVTSLLQLPQVMPLHQKNQQLLAHAFRCH